MDGPPQGQNAVSSRPARAHLPGSVLVLIGLFLLFGLFTYNYYPAVWCDEAFYSEPAINFVNHGSFYTYLSYVQPVKTFSVANTPGYFFTLAPWVKVFGSSLLAVRAYNYVGMAFGTALLCFMLVRFGLVQKRSALLWLVAALHLGYGMSYAYRCSRPDVTGMCLLLLMALSFSIGRNGWRWLCLFALAWSLPWFGLQVGFFAGFACMAGWWLLPWVRWREVLVIASGGMIGTGVMVLLLLSKGLLKYFMETVFAIMGRYYAVEPAASPVAKFAKVFVKSFGSYVEDFSAIPIIAGVVVLMFLYWKQFSPLTKRVLTFLMIVTLGVPVIFNLTGHFAFYYSYMKFVPVLVALWIIGTELNRARPEAHRRWYRPVAAGVVVVSMLVGLPLRLGLVAYTSKIMPRAEIKKMVASHIKPDDIVFSEYTAFFETKAIAEIVYIHWSSRTLQISRAQGRDFTPEEKAAISALIIRPKDFERITKFLGGEWRAVSEPFGDTQDYSALTRLPVIGRRIASYSSQPQSERYEVQIFRRVPTAIAFGEPKTATSVVPVR